MRPPEAPTGPAASPSHGGPESAAPVPDVLVPDAEPHYSLVWSHDLVGTEAAP